MARSGFPFMFGVYGTRATRETASLLKDTGACGALLLARNIVSPAQTRRLVRELQERVGRPLLFAVDHEGGWVLRFQSGLTAFPGNAALGRAKDPRLAYATGRRMALELKAVGIRLNLAPVLDVVTERYNPGIGIRSFGRDPKAAGSLGAAFIRGLQDHGVSACAKHFPGKGAARQDAHLTLPLIRLPARDFYARHLAPFEAAVRAGVDCVMTSHVRFPALDPAGSAATFSRRITAGLLRRRLGFQGVVISDDLCMGAVTERKPVQRAAVEALEAGHDLLIIAHDRQAQRESAQLLERALSEGTLSPARFEESVRRVTKLMKRRQELARGPWSPPPGGEALAVRVACLAVETVRQGAVALPLRLGPGGFRRVAVLWPDFREVRDRFTFEGGPQAPLARLRRRLKAWPARIRMLKTPILEPRGVERALREARASDLTIFFCFEAMRFAGQARALEALQREAPGRLVVCLMRNPWDRALIQPGVTALDAYGYRNCSIDALASALEGAG